RNVTGVQTCALPIWKRTYRHPTAVLVTVTHVAVEFTPRRADAGPWVGDGIGTGDGVGANTVEAGLGSGVEPAAPLLDAVLGLDGANGPGGRAHHHRLGGHVGGVIAHASQQVAVGDAGGGEVAVVGSDQIVGGEHPLEIVTGLDGLRALLLVLGGEPALEHATGALNGAGGDDALGGAAQSQQHVHAGAAGGSVRAGHVPVHDELDARPDSA